MGGVFSSTQMRRENPSCSCSKGKECKYWLDRINFKVAEAYSFQINNRDKRIVNKIIFECFEVIEKEWDKFQESK